MIARQPNRERHDLVIVDPEKLQWHMQRSANSRSQFADRMNIGRTSLYRMLNGIAVRRVTVRELAEQLYIPIHDLLPDETTNQIDQDAVHPWEHPEWELVPGTLLPVEALSNGLIRRTACVRHRVLTNELGRGKIYDIAGMPSAVRDACREALSRHAVVCRQLWHCPQIAENLTLTCSADQTIWTSVDRWFPGEPLVDVVAESPLTKDEWIVVMGDLARALKCLHAENIIVRELHPGHVLVADRQQAVLTDLDLAKLLDAEGSVSSAWQRNDFRAPEIAGGETHPQADLYSFAQLALYSLTGVTPDHPEPIKRLRIALPKSGLRSLLEAALSPVWTDRPQSITPLLKQFERRRPTHVDR